MTPLLLETPPEVQRIARRLEEAGFSTWAVGGAVRNALAGLPAGDWDLATAARPVQVQKLFRRTVPVGVEHGTVGVLGRDGKLYEVTTFRRDVETFGRRARVSFSDTIEEDLSRRDFTINAVAWHPLTGELRDPHGGARDLREGVLRTVGDPAERFREDWLRVLRGLRFAGQFGLRIHPETWRAASAAAVHLHALSAERIREELFKVLTRSPRPSVSLELYAQSGVLRELYPELNACIASRGESAAAGGESNRWSSLLRAADSISRHRLVVRLAALLHGVGECVGDSEGDAAGRSAALAREILQRLRCSNAQIDHVVHLIAQQHSLPPAGAPDAAIRRWIRRVGLAFLPDLLRLRIATLRARDAAADEQKELRKLVRRTQKILGTHPPLEIVDLAIGGQELMEVGVKPGPRLGEILRGLLERVLDDPELNTRQTLLALAGDEIEKGRSEDHP